MSGSCASRGTGSLAVSLSESPAELEPASEDEEREGQDVMPEADHDPACEPGAIRARSVPVGPTRQKRDDHEAAEHVPDRDWCRVRVPGRGRSDAHLTKRSSVSTTTTIGIDHEYLEDFGRARRRALPGPGHEVADVLVCNGTAHPWCVQALVRAIVATGDAKIILRSDIEPGILDRKHQAAAECRVKLGVTVII